MTAPRAGRAGAAAADAPVPRLQPTGHVRSRIGWLGLLALGASCARGRVAGDPEGDGGHGGSGSASADATVKGTPPALPDGGTDPIPPQPPADARMEGGGAGDAGGLSDASAAEGAPATDAADAVPLLANGIACADGARCKSGFCVDGFCCATDGCAVCETCAGLAGKRGTCNNIGRYAEDKNPPDACTGTNACDGAGACRKKNGQKCTAYTECVSGICAEGTCCSSVAVCGK